MCTPQSVCVLPLWSWRGKWSYCEINVKLMCKWLLLKFSCLPSQSVIRSISFSVWEHHFCSFNLCFHCEITESIYNVKWLHVPCDISLCWFRRQLGSHFQYHVKNSYSCDCEVKIQTVWLWVLPKITTQRALWDTNCGYITLWLKEILLSDSFVIISFKIRQTAAVWQWWHQIYSTLLLLCWRHHTVHRWSSGTEENTS